MPEIIAENVQCDNQFLKMPNKLVLSSEFTSTELIDVMIIIHDNRLTLPFSVQHIHSSEKFKVRP